MEPCKPVVIRAIVVDRLRLIHRDCVTRAEERKKSTLFNFATPGFILILKSALVCENVARRFAPEIKTMADEDSDPLHIVEECRCTSSTAFARQREACEKEISRMRDLGIKRELRHTTALQVMRDRHAFAIQSLTTELRESAQRYEQLSMTCVLLRQSLDAATSTESAPPTASVAPPLPVSQPEGMVVVRQTRRRSYMMSPT
jgi:hypothetical protein